MANETQKKHHFNIIDFVLILTALACIIGVALRYNLHNTLTHETDVAEVDILIEGLLESSAKAIVAGDIYYNTEDDTLLGEVLSVRTRPAKKHYENSDGTIAYATLEGRVDAIVTLRVTGYVTEQGFLVSGKDYIGAGADFPVAGRYIETICTVTDVRHIMTVQELAESGNE